MRILVDSGCYDCVNMGDVAMLQVALNRIREFWPDARIQVITNNVECLTSLCPTAEPIPVSGKRGWLSNEPLQSYMKRLLPKPAAEQVVKLNRSMRRHWPITFRSTVSLTRRLTGSDFADVGSFLSAVESCDLLIICGQGGLTDHAHSHAMQLLGLVEMAVRKRIAVVMLGQGVGPMADSELLGAARAVLPQVNLIALRENLAGLPLLRQLGVDQSRVVNTGDDAIELAYEARSTNPGDALGINLRVARSSGVEYEFIPTFRDVISTFLANHAETPLVPLPIGRGIASADCSTLREVLKGIDDSSDGGEALDTPLKVIQQTARCRLVVTGAYHAAVFALAQGIPTICLAKSPYFIDKFVGLEAQFGDGCCVVLIKSPRVEEELVTSMECLWEASYELRDRLQQAALRQISSGRKIYERINDLTKSTVTRVEATP
jgi:polysaccharide pyruvyl transferase WcaK-like protein